MDFIFVGFILCGNCIEIQSSANPYLFRAQIHIFVHNYPVKLWCSYYINKGSKVLLLEWCYTLHDQYGFLMEFSFEVIKHCINNLFFLEYGFKIFCLFD